MNNLMFAHFCEYKSAEDGKSGNQFADIITNAFLCLHLFKFHCDLFMWANLKISYHWFRYWLSTEQAQSHRHHLNQWWFSSLTDIFITKYRSLNGSNNYYHLTTKPWWVLHDDIMTWKHSSSTTQCRSCDITLIATQHVCSSIHYVRRCQLLTAIKSKPEETKEKWQG